VTTTGAVEAAAILALLVLLEGVRTLAPETGLLRRTMWGRWIVATPVRLGGGVHVVSWLVPLALPVLLPSASDEEGDGSVADSALESMRSREARAHLDVRALQVNGTLIAAMLVIGVPFLTWSRGGFGLIIALLQLLFATTLQAMVVHGALVRVCAPAPFARWIWPFTAIRAAEALQERIVGDVPCLLAIRELLGDDSLLCAYRTDLHDLMRGHESSADARAIVAMVGMERVRAFLDDRPQDLAEEAFCPRCASRYRPGVTECGACELQLVRGAA
jgi:hypothetical protein